MLSIPQAVEHTLIQLAPARIFVAFSGGVDSTALLHAVSQLGLNISVIALHVNHQISRNAEQWQKHCEMLACQLGVEFIAERVTVKNTGVGVEASAREARMTVFEKHLTPGDVLLCGHHQGDQFETFWLRAIRGAGTAGLSGILPARPLGAGIIVRPLLNFTKSQLQHYAKLNGLSWVEDESNQSTHFDRNYFRQKIAPLILNRWPHAAEKIAQACEHLADDRALMAQYASEDVARLAPQVERMGHSILMPLHNGWDRVRINHVLRYWLHLSGLNAPSKKQLDEIHHLMEAASDRQPEVVLGEYCIRRFKERLYCLPKIITQPKWQSSRLYFEPGLHLQLVDGSQLKIKLAAAGLKQGEYQIAYRSISLRAHPFGRAHSQTLKRLLQEYDVEPWLRDRVPLVFAGEELAAVGDYWVEKSFYSTQNALELQWQYEHNF